MKRLITKRRSFQPNDHYSNMCHNDKTVIAKVCYRRQDIRRKGICYYSQNGRIFLSFDSRTLKREMHGNAHSRTIYSGMITISQTPDIFDPQYRKYVVETSSELHIRCLLIHHTGCRRESP